MRPVNKTSSASSGEGSANFPILIIFLLALMPAPALLSCERKPAGEGVAVDKKAARQRQETAARSRPKSRFGRWFAMSRAARVSYEAGNLEEAQKKIDQLSRHPADYKKSWDYGNYLHYRYIIAGAVALEKGQVDDACKSLIQASTIQTSPQLRTFGPDVRLADKLLARGRRESVVKYLANVQRFWTTQRNRLMDWIDRLNRGEEFSLTRAKDMPDPNSEATVKDHLETIREITGK